MELIYFQLLAAILFCIGIYGDTDSIAFLQNGKSKDEIMKFLGEINSDLPGIMELDLEEEEEEEEEEEIGRAHV